MKVNAASAMSVNQKISRRDGRCCRICSRDFKEIRRKVPIFMSEDHAFKSYGADSDRTWQSELRNHALETTMQTQLTTRAPTLSVMILARFSSRWTKSLIADHIAVSGAARKCRSIRCAAAMSRLLSLRSTSEKLGLERVHFPIIVIQEAGWTVWIHRVLQNEGSRATWSIQPRCNILDAGARRLTEST